MALNDSLEEVDRSSKMSSVGTDVLLGLFRTSHLGTGLCLEVVC